MFKKDTVEMAAKSSRVKKTIAAGFVAAMATLAPATSHALEIVTNEYQVSFSRSELSAPEGVEAVYTKIEKKAKSACGMGRTVDEQGQIISRQECIDDMVKQFVTDAGVEELVAFHEDKTKQAG